MRILVLTMWYPNEENWVFGPFVHQQAIALRACGAEVKIMQPLPRTPFPISLFKRSYRSWARIPRVRTYEGFDVYQPRYVTLPRQVLYHHVGEWMYAGIKEVVAGLYRQWPFDVIQAHTTYPCGYAANAIRDRLLPGITVIHTVHRYSIEDVPRHCDRCRELVRRSLLDAERIVFVSTRGRDLAATIAGGAIRERSHYITNGVNPEQFRFTAGDLDGIATLREKYRGTTNIVFLGYLSEVKGVPELLGAVRRLRDAGEHALRFFLVGANRLGSFVPDYVRSNNLSDMVVTVGPVLHDEVKRWLKFADLFVLPSHSEGVPTVLFEALYLGVPSIFADVGGISRVVDNRRHCLIIEPRSEQAIVDSVMELAQNPELRARLSEEGSRLMREYTWERNARENLDLFRTVVSSKGPRPLR